MKNRAITEIRCRMQAGLRWWKKPGERNLNKSKICFHPSTRASKVGAT
jgi:hypothetical protein